MTADPLVRVTGLRKAFGAHRVLDGLALEVRAGEAVALLGANGAGKTTLLKILATLMRPTRGTVLVAGHDCAREPERVRPHVGLIGHGSHVYEDLTALENLKFWTALAGLRAAPAELAASAPASSAGAARRDRKSTRLNSSHSQISYAVFCLKNKTQRLRRFVRSPSNRGWTRCVLPCWHRPTRWRADTADDKTLLGCARNPHRNRWIPRHRRP